jgi:hypothetical protein
MFTNNANKLKETLKLITKLLYINFFTQMIKNNILFWLLCIESQFSTYFNKVIIYLSEMQVVL